jgi:ParB-like nuclease domain
MTSQTSPHRVEQWPIERLVEYTRNPRKNDSAVDRMCASIREFGFKIPILARSDGEVVDGHLRLKAARKLGIVEIPVILCNEWTPAQVCQGRSKSFPLRRSKRGPLICLNGRFPLTLGAAGAEPCDARRAARLGRSGSRLQSQSR